MELVLILKKKRNPDRYMCVYIIYIVKRALRRETDDRLSSSLGLDLCFATGHRKYNEIEFLNAFVDCEWDFDLVEGDGGRHRDKGM